MRWHYLYLGWYCFQEIFPDQRCRLVGQSYTYTNLLNTYPMILYKVHTFEKKRGGHSYARQYFLIFLFHPYLDQIYWNIVAVKPGSHHAVKSAKRPSYCHLFSVPPIGFADRRALSLPGLGSSRQHSHSMPFSFGYLAVAFRPHLRECRCQESPPLARPHREAF